VCCTKYIRDGEQHMYTFSERERERHTERQREKALKMTIAREWRIEISRTSDNGHKTYTFKELNTCAVDFLTHCLTRKSRKCWS